MGDEAAELSVAAMLRRLSDEAATGCLRLSRQGTQGTVWLRDGQVYTAAAPEARPRLGDRLVGAGHITQEQLDAALQLQRSVPSSPRIGELLISTGLIDREMMSDYVREQILDSVAAMLGWSDGEWSFYPDEEISEDVALDMSVENLLMDAARRLEEFEVIQDRLGSMDAVVDFAPGGTQANLALTADEWSMLTRIDGTSSVRDLADASGYSQLETARIVYGLLTAGVVQTVGGTTPPDEAAAAQPEETEATGTADASEVDRMELLREFAALDEEPEPGESGWSSRARPASQRRPAPGDPADPADRKGLFGRFRRS